MTVALLATLSTSARAQADEIQVYDAGIAARGVFNLTWHNNYIANGIRGQAFRGAVAADRSFNGVPEWAYGLTRWFEAGLYMPLYSRDQTVGWGFNGFKLRALFVVPDADNRTFVYGLNFETSYNAKRWDTRRITEEMRPIIGWHLKPVDIMINPILDTRFEGGIKGLEFVPAVRLAYNISEDWAIAAEEYAGLGTLGNLQAVSDQVHQLFAVVDHKAGSFDLEAGAGFGITNGSDKLTFKLIISRDLNRKK
jgi:hypothetical protein